MATRWPAIAELPILWFRGGREPSLTAARIHPQSDLFARTAQAGRELKIPPRLAIDPFKLAVDNVSILGGPIIWDDETGRYHKLYMMRCSVLSQGRPHRLSPLYLPILNIPEDQIIRNPHHCLFQMALAAFGPFVRSTDCIKLESSGPTISFNGSQSIIESLSVADH